MLRMIFIFALAATTITKVPSYIPVCGRKDPNLDDCVKESVEALRGKLRTGMPELDVPSIEPLPIKMIQLANETNFNIIAENVNLYGLPDFNVKSLHVDLKEQKIDIDVIFSKIRLTAVYDVFTRIVVPISGKGPIDIVADDVAAEVNIKYELASYKGNRHFYISSITVKLTVKDYISRFMSEGADNALAEAVNSVLNGNRQDIIELITPNLEKAITEEVLSLSNKITKQIPYDEALPDRE